MPDSADWKTNASLAEIAEFLRGKRRIVVTTHVKPDGDAVGSSLALVRALNLPGAWGPWVPANRAEAWYFGPMPPWLRDIAGDTPYRVLDSGGMPEVDGLDAVVVVDTGSWLQLEALREWITARHEMVSLIDHHVQGNAAVAPRRHIDTSAAAACQPVAELCRLLLGKGSLAELPGPVAEMLYLGLATDTGWFRHSNVNHRVMETAGELLDAKADNVRLYQVVEQRESVSRLKLLSRALASLELFDHDRIAVMTLTREDFHGAHAQPGESGGFVDFGQAISGVLVTALLTEAEPGEFGGRGPVTKVSLRSKVGVDVNAVAKVLGGGGHVQAAGARPSLAMDAAKREVVRLVSIALKG
ncbi:bifunctional oligoribonuclease and PAP phosphatase NrnA [Phycisphaerales bacterium]|nr:bifunctional oligoribonuclease and PAP phosphatase NrnA [Phycisphaerales bacterium]